MQITIYLKDTEDENTIERFKAYIKAFEAEHRTKFNKSTFIKSLLRDFFKNKN